MDGLNEHKAPRGAVQNGSEQGCDSRSAKAMAPRNLMPPEMESILAMTDDELLAEALTEGRDIKAEADRARAMFDRVKRKIDARK